MLGTPVGSYALDRRPDLGRQQPALIGKSLRPDPQVLLQLSLEDLPLQSAQQEFTFSDLLLSCCAIPHLCYFGLQLCSVFETLGILHLAHEQSNIFLQLLALVFATFLQTVLQTGHQLLRECCMTLLSCLCHVPVNVIMQSQNLILVGPTNARHVLSNSPATLSLPQQRTLPGRRGIFGQSSQAHLHLPGVLALALAPVPTLLLTISLHAGLERIDSGQHFVDGADLLAKEGMQGGIGKDAAKSAVLVLQASGVGVQHLQSGGLFGHFGASGAVFEYMSIYDCNLSVLIDQDALV